MSKTFFGFLSSSYPGRRTSIPLFQQPVTKMRYDGCHQTRKKEVSLFIHFRNRSSCFHAPASQVYRWLDAVWPLRSGGEVRGGCPSSGGSKRKAPSPTPPHDGWASRAYSAITRQQQTTGFDCGVASLLYAEKCGQGQMREDVDAWTTQADMTEYRRALQRYVEEVLRHDDEPPPTSSGSPRSDGGEASPEVVVVDPPLPLPASAPDPPAAAVAVPAAKASAPLSLS